MLEAAIPVLAVTETTSGLDACFFLSAVMMALKSKDFPVPTKEAASSSTHHPVNEEKKQRKRQGAKCTCWASKEDVLSLLNDHPQNPYLLIAQHYIKDFLLRITSHTIDAWSEPYGNRGGKETVDG
jgi:hypothetical protein